jgi:hypothetical protein
VVEESIMSARHEEEEVHQDSFKSLGPGCVLGLGPRIKPLRRILSVGSTMRFARFGCPRWLGIRPPRKLGKWPQRQADRPFFRRGRIARRCRRMKQLWLQVRRGWPSASTSGSGVGTTYGVIEVSSRDE